MNTRRYWLALGFMLLSILLVACSGSANPGTSAGEAALTDTTWKLFAIDKRKPIEAPNEITLTFSDGQVSGNSGCNSFGGSYSVNGDNIQFSQLASTMMACMEPEGIMEQEQIILQYLNQAKTYRFEDGRLVIVVSDQETLTYDDTK
ncbi:MAG TPA: META domain-containing protein [Anaerolineales bacterium]|nr:META domain-containing protein [Anaerolineales bacterium]